MAGKIVAEIWLDVRPFNGGPGSGPGGGLDDGAGSAVTENALNNGVIIDSPDGGITFLGAGSIKGGKTAYDVGQGFWFGADGTDPLYYKVAIGDPNGDTFNWDGTEINSKMNNLELRGWLRGPAEFVIDPATHGDATGEVVIAGDMEIEGTTLQVPNDFTIDPATHGDDTGSLIIAGATLKVPDEFTIDPATHGDNTGEVNIAGSLEIAGDTLKVPNEFTIDPATHGDNTGEINIAGNLEVAGGTIKGPATIVIDPAVIGATSGLVQILGDLQVDGLTTTINSSVMTVDDKNIVIGEGATNAAAVNLGGITLEGANATLLYTSSDDKWNFNKGLNVTGDIDSTGDITATGALIGETLDIGGGDLTVNANGDLVTAGSISVAATSNLNGNVNLGDNNVDDIVFNGLVNSRIIPDGGSTHDLGTTGNTWRNLYVDSVYAGELDVGDGDFIVDEDGNLDANGGTFASLTIDSATPGTILKQVSAQGNPMSIVAHTTMNIENVDSAAPNDATVLKYNNANTQYESVDFKTTSLEDVSTTTASDNQILKYNSSATEYQPVDHETTELEDVSSTAPTNEQVLQYNSTSSKYEPTTLTLGMFDDVTIADVQNLDLLVYQDSTADWRNKSKAGAGFAAIASSGSWNDLSNTPTTLGGYGITDAYTKTETYSRTEVDNLLYTDSDVDTHLNRNTANTNELLSYNGSDYEWVTYAEIVGAPETLGELNDVSLGTPSSGEILKYNGTNWVDATLNFSDLGNTPTTLSGYGITDGFSGNYNDLSNKPTIPAAYTNADVDAHLNRSSANTGSMLYWNGSDYAWLTSSTSGNINMSLGQLSDVSLGTLNQNDYLKWDGSAWVDSVIDWTHIANKPTFITSADLYTDADVDSHLNRSSAGTNQVLAWNGSDYAWVTPSSGSSNVQDLDDLSDVVLGTLASGEVLKYNGTNWVDGSVSFSELGNTPTTLSGYGITDGYSDSDVDAHLNKNSAGTGEVLSWNGTDYDWVANGDVAVLNDLDDVTISSPQDDNILAYNSTTSQFENTAFTIGQLSNVQTAADNPPGTVQALGSNPSALMYNTSSSEWTVTPIEIDDLYGIPPPASSGATAGAYLAVKNNAGTSSVSHPEEYEWVTPRIDAGEDYEEGTFTVQLFDAGSGGNSVTQSQAGVVGTYTKVGRLCMCHINIFNANTTGLTSTNTLYFSLPFTVASDTFPLGQVNILQASSAAASSMRHVYVYGYTGSPRGSFAMNPATSGASATSFTVAEMVNDDTTDLRISLAYQTT